MKVKRWVWGALLVAGLLGVAGCGPQATHPQPARATATAPPAAATAAPPTATPVLASAATPTAAAMPTLTPLPPPAAILPPAITPHPAWRPPLYPVPWAPTSHDHFLLARPLPACCGAMPVADYRFGGVFFRNEVHTGVDIPGDPGTPVLAAGSGQVVWAGYGLSYGRPGKPGPYGLVVMIRHPFGWDGKNLYTVYAHLSEVAVHAGWWVEQGAFLGRVGNTGHTTGPHLHFEVRLGTVAADGKVSFEVYNPELWWTPALGWGVVVGQVLDGWGQPLYHAAVYIASLEDEDFHWRTYTYGRSGIVRSDPYYRENYVFGDLPAGRYRITVDYYGGFHSQEVVVYPGQVTFFRFRGWQGFEPNAHP